MTTAVERKEIGAPAAGDLVFTKGYGTEVYWPDRGWTLISGFNLTRLLSMPWGLPVERYAKVALEDNPELP